MDAQVFISLSINQLQDVLRDEATTRNWRLEKQVRKAIDSLRVSKQLLKDGDHDHLADASSSGSVNNQMITVRLLKAVYSADDAAGTFLIAKEILRVQKDEDEHFRANIVDCCFWWLCCCGCCCTEENSENDWVTRPMKYMCRRYVITDKLKTLYSSILFTRKMKKFNDEVRRLVEIMKGAGGTLNAVNDNNTRLLSIENDRLLWGRISDFCLEEEAHVVGLQQQINDLVFRLIPQLNFTTGSSRVDVERLNSTGVISVIGEGGSGKTTLARSVYNRIDVKRHFTHRAWVRVHSWFGARGVLADILQQINSPKLVPTLSEDGLKLKLTKLLQGTRFLIVLEDGDTLPQVFWKSLQDILSFSSQCGKVIVTVRNTDSLAPCLARSTLDMCRLDGEESWKLFSKKVRIAEDELNGLKLIELQERILKICGGLPSAIVLLGGLLSTKEQSYYEWSRVLNTLASESHEGVLALSYEDLPSIVKLCFLYMSVVFPRGFEIPVRRLIHLWCAEGFVTPSDADHENYPEDVAEMCLEELVTRNMVQVRRRLDGSPKTCCMPNVLYDFFSSKAANNGFFCHQQFLSSQTYSKQLKFAVRRFTSYEGIDDFSPSSHSLKNVRSYVDLDTRVPITPARGTNMFLKMIIGSRGFGLLKVLDLEGVYKPKLLGTVRYLLLLSYLSLRSTFVDDLPDVDFLSRLETLDVKNTDISHLDFGKNPELQHVYLNRRLEARYFYKLANVRTLWGLHVNTLTVLDLPQKIRKLGVTISMEANAGDVAKWINGLTELQSLKLRAIHEQCYPLNIKLQRMTRHYKLQELYVLGNLSQSPINVGFLPPNLRKLTLSGSQLKVDPMPVLGQLPHLNILRLFGNSYRGTRMTCVSEGFPKLHLLKLWNLPAVKVWIVEEGAMPCLRELEIRRCENLKTPQGLQNVTTLKELVLTHMPTDFRVAVEESLHDRDVYFIVNNEWNSDPFPNERVERVERLSSDWDHFFEEIESAIRIFFITLALAVVFAVFLSLFIIFWFVFPFLRKSLFS